MRDYSLSEIGNDIKMARQSWHITQKDLAKTLEISVPVLSNWEHRNWPDDATLRKVANKISEGGVLPFCGNMDEFVWEFSDDYANER